MLFLETKNSACVHAAYEIWMQSQLGRIIIHLKLLRFRSKNQKQLFLSKIDENFRFLINKLED